MFHIYLIFCFSQLSSSVTILYHFRLRSTHSRLDSTINISTSPFRLFLARSVTIGEPRPSMIHMMIFMQRTLL